jgi:hypothetical protein
LVENYRPPLSACIFIELRRKKSTDKTEKFKRKDDPRLAELRRRFGSLGCRSLREVEPSMPAWLENSATL